MQVNSWLPLLLRILLPFAVALSTGLAPVPKALHPALSRAQVAEGEGNTEAAALAYRQVVEMQPWRTDLRLRTAHLFYSGEQWAEAAALLEDADARQPLSTEDRLLLAESYDQLGQYDEAVAIWGAMLSGPGADEALFERVAGLQRSLGLYPALEETYRGWIAAFPQNPAPYYRLGVLLTISDPAAAAPMLNLAKTLDPARVSQADRLLAALETAETEEGALRSVEIGRAMGSIGEWAYARRSFEDALTVEPDYAEAWALLAEAQQQLGEPSYEAIQRANQISPDSVVVKALTAIYWRRQNDPEQALQVLDELITLQPEETVWMVEKGAVFAQIGNLEAAAQTLAGAIEREPQNPLYRQKLVEFCLQNNYEVRAIGLPAARQYLLLDEESSQSLDMMGAVMLSLQDLVSARRYLERALQADENNATAHLHLGQVYLVLGQQPQALTHLMLAASLDENGGQTAAVAQALMQRYFSDTSP